MRFDATRERHLTRLARCVKNSNERSSDSLRPTPRGLNEENKIYQLKWCIGEEKKPWDKKFLKRH